MTKRGAPPPAPQWSMLVAHARFRARRPGGAGQPPGRRRGRARLRWFPGCRSDRMIQCARRGDLPTPRKKPGSASRWTGTSSAAATTHGAAEHGGRAAVVVAQRPEQVGAARGEDEVAGAALDRGAQRCPGFEVDDVDGVVLRTPGGPRPRRSGGGRRCAPAPPRRKVGVRLRHRVHVEQHLLRGSAVTPRSAPATSSGCCAPGA